MRTVRGGKRYFLFMTHRINITKYERCDQYVAWLNKRSKIIFLLIETFERLESGRVFVQFMDPFFNFQLISVYINT